MEKWQGIADSSLSLMVRELCCMVGGDGVMVPVITVGEKAKRRAGRKPVRRCGKSRHRVCRHPASAGGFLMRSNNACDRSAESGRGQQASTCKDFLSGTRC